MLCWRIGSSPGHTLARVVMCTLHQPASSTPTTWTTPVATIRPSPPATINHNHTTPHLPHQPSNAHYATLCHIMPLPVCFPMSASSPAWHSQDDASPTRPAITINNRNVLGRKLQQCTSNYNDKKDFFYKNFCVAPLKYKNVMLIFI